MFSDLIRFLFWGNVFLFFFFFFFFCWFWQPRRTKDDADEINIVLVPYQQTTEQLLPSYRLHDAFSNKQILHSVVWLCTDQPGRLFLNAESCDTYGQHTDKWTDNIWLDQQTNREALKVCLSLFFTVSQRHSNSRENNSFVNTTGIIQWKLSTSWGGYDSSVSEWLWRWPTVCVAGLHTCLVNFVCLVLKGGGFSQVLWFVWGPIPTGLIVPKNHWHRLRASELQLVVLPDLERSSV